MAPSQTAEATRFTERQFTGPWRVPAQVKSFAGELAERSNAAVLKTVSPRGLGGSNPSLSARTCLSPPLGEAKPLIAMPVSPAPITRTSLPRWLTVFPADIMALHERSSRGAPGNPPRRAPGPHGRSRAGLRARQRLHPAARVCRGVRALLRAQSQALPPPRRFAAGGGAAAVARRRPRHPHRRAALPRLPRRRAGGGRRRHPAVQARGRDPRNRDYLPLSKGARRAGAPRPAGSYRHRGPRAPLGGRSHGSARGRAAAFLGLRHHAAIGGARRASVSVHHARAGPHAGDRPDERKPREPVIHEPPLAETESLATIANHWLAMFEKALAGRDDVLLKTLFHPDSHWRDVLALTWHIRTVNGLEAVIGELKAHAGRAHPTGFRTDPHRTAPRHVTRAGTDAIEAIFQFETDEGRGNGVLRLLPHEKKMRAWTLLTALDEIKGFEEQVGTLRPKGERDPVVLVVGGGQAGLSIAARLTQLQVDTLIVDRGQRIGDNWRNRYRALTLHNQVQVNHLPYMPFPPNWPTYIPKDKLAGWFESYVDSIELNYWKATEVSGIPNLPDIPTLRNFGCKILHSSQYGDGEAWKGKSALVIGTGNSGHDIAQDLYSNGAKVTLVQRSPTLIVNIEPSAQLPYALYSEATPLEDCDLITSSVPMQLLRATHRMLTE